MSEPDMKQNRTCFSLALKTRLVTLLVFTSGLVGMASAAIDFSNISALITEVVLIVPGILNLVIGIVPLLVTVGIISAIVLFLNSIIQKIG